MSKARDLANQVSNLITISTGGSNFVTPQVLSASIANIDLSLYATNAQLSASVANIDVTSSLDSRIFISSASPTSGNTNGRLWIDPTTASSPVVSIYGSGTWNSFRQGRIKAEGGIKSYVGNYTVHKFTSSSSFTCYENLNIEYLIVAGGGGGGVWVGGGGGGGGLLNGNASINSSTYSMVIGSGGIGGYGIGVTSATLLTSATNGNNSTAFGLTAIGGGRGASWDLQDGLSGGSGGGRDQTRGTTRLTGTSGQGYSGGISIYTGGFPGGGGGGAGGQGGDASSISIAGSGGIGVLNAIDGSSSYYSGGGGGGLNTPPGSAGAGGLGGGGNGAVGTGNTITGSVAVSGLLNTGGGGGAAGQGSINPNATGGNGGSGIIIIRYLT
jgi:hypothetical protein